MGSAEHARMLGIELMRRLAIEGSRGLYGRRKTMLENSFFSGEYSNFVELSDRQINNELSYEYIKARRRRGHKFFVTPFSEQGCYDVVLFRPHFRGTEVIKVEILQIGKVRIAPGGNAPMEKYEIGFRFESDNRDGPHGYPHVQFTKNFPGSVNLTANHDSYIHLSHKYPVIPLAEKKPHSRVFSAMTSFAGLQFDGSKGLPAEIEKLENTGGTQKEFDMFKREAKLTCVELSRTWNGKRGFNNGTWWGRVLDRIFVR